MMGGFCVFEVSFVFIVLQLFVEQVILLLFIFAYVN